MCGRYVFSRGVDDLVAEFEAIDATGGWPLPADYNVAPTKDVPAVLARPVAGRGAEPVRQLRMLRWGLVPSWAGDPSAGAQLINARIETVATKPAFRAALARRRCLLPADGWYEWGPRDGWQGRQPYFITAHDGGLLAFAGLYEFWGTGGASYPLVSCAIVTSEATGQLRRVHDRMPVVLDRAGWATWLDPAVDDPAELLVPTVPELVAGLDLRPVGDEVGNVANNGPHLVAPVHSRATPETLF